MQTLVLSDNLSLEFFLAGCNVKKRKYWMRKSKKSGINMLISYIEKKKKFGVLQS